MCNYYLSFIRTQALRQYFTTNAEKSAYHLVSVQYFLLKEVTETVQVSRAQTTRVGRFYTFSSKWIRKCRKEDSFQVSTLSSWAVSAFSKRKVMEEKE